jgi:predicted nuclease with TOPRIM domain
MIYAKEILVKTNKELQEEIKNLEKMLQKTKKESQKLDEINSKLQDEIDSLWFLMDEVTKADVKNVKDWTGILDHLENDKMEKDTLAKILMVTDKKAEA